MQTRFAIEHVPPSSSLQASQGHFPRGPCYLFSRETHTCSHFDPRSCRYNSFMWQPDKAIFPCSGSTVSVFHCSPLSTNSSPPSAHVLSSVHFTSTPPSPPACTPFLHLLFCLLSFSPGDRVQVIDDSNEEWWKVGNKSFANICMSCVLVFLMCMFVCV